MPRTAGIVRLPPQVKSELDRRLKESGYGDLTEHAEWLNVQGYPISKSALGRYSVEAKARSLVSSKISRAINAPPADHESLVDLLIELGTLRVREADILARIDALGIDGFSIQGLRDESGQI